MHGRRLASTTLLASLLVPAAGLAQAPPPGVADDPSCTTTWSVTTKCTGAAAPLAVPPPQQAVQPAPIYAPPPGYAPAPVYPAPPAYLPPLPPPVRPSHVEMRPRTGLMVAGAAVFGGSYLWNAFAGYVGGEGRLAIPVAGPLLLIHGDGVENRLGNALLVFDGLVQATGVVLFIAGAATRHPVKVYDDVAPRISVVPTVTLGGGGLAAVGTF